MGIEFYIDKCSTLSTAAATILAEPSISDDRFPGVSPKALCKALRHTTEHFKIRDLEE